MKSPIKIWIARENVHHSWVLFTSNPRARTQHEYIRLDSIYICPECGDSGVGYFPECPPDTHCEDCKEYIPEVSCSESRPCPCLKNPNSIASIKRGGSDNAK